MSFDAARPGDDDEFVARTMRARAALAYARRSSSMRLALLGCVPLLWHEVEPRLLVGWSAVVILDVLRARLSLRRSVVALDQHGASASWSRRQAPRWALNGLSIALLPTIASLSGSAPAGYLAGLVALGAATLAVTVAQGFAALTTAMVLPSIVAGLVTGPFVPQMPRFAFVGTVVYAVILGRLHRDVASNTVRLSMQTARNERLNAELSGERERLVEVQAALEHANTELAHHALHDPLTGLGNRAMLTRVLPDALAALGPQDALCVLYADLDRFKALNDSRGHAVGDELLCGVADRLRTLVRQGDTVTRVGGDEFVVVLRSCGSADIATHVARRIEHDLGRPFELSDGPASVGVTIGLAMADAGTDASALIAAADADMYSQKHDRHARVP